MSLMEKITGRARKALGDLAEQRSLRRQGRAEGHAGGGRSDLQGARERVEEQARGDMERRPEAERGRESDQLPEEGPPEQIVEDARGRDEIREGSRHSAGGAGDEGRATGHPDTREQ
jgi:uncharacterized protein YjbJ (UPF0337 family)